MNIIYIHVCCIGNYKEIFTYLMDCIKKSGLYDNVKEIRCCILGNYDATVFDDKKIIIRAISHDISLYEVFTINHLYEDCKNAGLNMESADFNVLYLHTKGVTKPDNINVKSWLEYLCYFNIYQYETCLQLLEYNDTVGVNLQNDPECHYSGNIWWSKSSYIKKLEKCQYTCYNSPEFWLTKDKNGEYISLWRSNCNHYGDEYNRENYENKPILPYKLL